MNKSDDRDNDFKTRLTDEDRISLSTHMGDVGIQGKAEVSEVDNIDDPSRPAFLVEFDSENIGWNRKGDELDGDQPSQRHIENEDTGDFDQTIDDALNESNKTNHSEKDGIKQLILDHQQIVPFMISILLMMVGIFVDSNTIVIFGSILMISTGIHYGSR